MGFITPFSLLVGLILSAPGLWRAWSDPSTDITGALLRFLLAVVLASVSISALESVIRAYRRGVGRPHRRASERAAMDRDAGNSGTH